MEEIENEICELLPTREELAVIDTGFTNPGFATAHMSDAHTSGHTVPVVHTPPTHVPYQPPVIHQPIVYHPAPVDPDCDFDRDGKDDHDWNRDGKTDGNEHAYKRTDWNHPGDNGKHLGWYKHDDWNNHDWNKNWNTRWEHDGDNRWEHNKWEAPAKPISYAPNWQPVQQPVYQPIQPWGMTPNQPYVSPNTWNSWDTPTTGWNTYDPINNWNRNISYPGPSYYPNRYV